MEQVKLEQVIDPSKASPEKGEDTTTALVAVDTSSLNEESLEILNQIIAAEDAEKTKDLTYLFNINQNKKTMVRIDKLSELQDKLVAQFSKRVTERPDEISNQELMQALKIVQDIIERGTKQVVGQAEQPLIQINQQTNSVNVGDDAAGLNRDSRDKVKRAIMSILENVKDATATEVVDADPIVVNGDEDDD
jgi:hypothetical protein